MGHAQAGTQERCALPPIDLVDQHLPIRLAHYPGNAAAAVDLHGRIDNIEARDFFAFYREGTESERTYTLDHTLYVFAEYFGWAEILRRETQFLNLGDVERTRQVRKGLDAISETFLSNEI